MKYLTKYITKDILIIIAILLFVSIVFLVLTNKVIENAENNMPTSKTSTPLDNKLSEAAKNHIDKNTTSMNSLTNSLTKHVSAVTEQTDKKKTKK